jgi:hypothetical protein
MYPIAAIDLEIERSVRGLLVCTDFVLRQVMRQAQAHSAISILSFLLTMRPRVLIPDNLVMLSHSQKGILRLGSTLTTCRILCSHGRA